MWEELSTEFKTAFEEAWTAFMNGNIPIGAVVCDGNGNILIREHNRTAESGPVNRKIAHAEMNAISRIDTSEVNVKSVVLYTTMEPCPMCMGTAVMSNIRHLRYAARDPYCGAVHLKEDDPYLRSQDLDYTHTGGAAEFVQLVLQSYHELKCIESGSSDAVLRRFSEVYGEAVETARKLFAYKKLDDMALKDVPVKDVCDMIAGTVSWKN